MTRVTRPADPARAALERELAAFRSDHARLTVERLDRYPTLIDLLGAGNAERAWESLERLRSDYGGDPSSPIGAFFWTSGWGDENPVLDRRLEHYAERFAVDPRTGRRRGSQGISQLAVLIRDRTELARPWAIVSLFQSGRAVQLVVDFHLAAESWRPPVVSQDGVAVPLGPFHVTADRYEPGRLWSRTVLPEVQLPLNSAFTEVMLRYRVLWEMPIWPTWQLTGWLADPRIMLRLRTFRERAAEVTLEWWREEPPELGPALVQDAGLWASRGGVTAVDVARTTSSLRRDRHRASD